MKINIKMTRPSPDPVYILRGSTTPVSSITFQNNDFLYSGHTDGHVQTWSMKSKRITSSLNAHSGQSVLLVEFTNENCMLTQSRGGEVKVWRTASEEHWSEQSKTEVEIRGGKFGSGNLGFCRGGLIDKRKVAVPGEDQSEVKVYDLETGKVTARLGVMDTEKKFGMCMSIKSAGQYNDGTMILIGYEDGSVALWDTRECKLVDSLKVHEESLMCMAYSEGLSKGFSGSANEILKSWTCEDKEIVVKDSIKTTNPGFNDVIVRKDKKIVVTAGWDFKIRVFGAKRLKPLAVLCYHKDSVNCLTFSDDNLLACGSKDNQISLWDIYR